MIEIGDLNKIQRITDGVPQMSVKMMSQKKKVSVNDAKYSLYEYLGKENIDQLCKKENIVFFQDK